MPRLRIRWVPDRDSVELRFSAVRLQQQQQQRDATTNVLGKERQVALVLLSKEKTVLKNPPSQSWLESPRGEDWVIISCPSSVQ